MKVSVCICMYNSAKFIVRCLSTIPDREDLEIIIVDDCSKDNSVEVANNYLSKLTKSKYLIIKNGSNMGVGYNRNILIEKSDGEYIFFLDSDDWLITPKFNHIINNILNNQDILIAKYIRNDRFSGYPTILRGCFIRKAYIGSIRHNPTARCFEDVGFKRALKESKNGELNESYIDEIIYHYNLPREDSITWNHWKNKGLPAYQRDLNNWEIFYNGKPR